MPSANTTKYYSSKQEKMVAKALGGYQVGLSGAGPGNPGDVKTYDWLVECKTHTEPGHRITFNNAVWKKIEDEAMAIHRKPVLIVDDGSQKESRTWCLCRAANLNLARVISSSTIEKAKKNLSFNDEILSSGIKTLTKTYVGETYEYAVYEIEWEGETVVISPLSTFKELFDR